MVRLQACLPVPSPVSPLTHRSSLSVLTKKSKTWPLIQKAENVGISVLSSQNLNSINQLKQNAVTRFKDLVYRVEAETAVLLPDATAHFVVTPEEFINAGDHVLALWRVKDHQSQANKNPLVFHGSTIKPLRK